MWPMYLPRKRDECNTQIAWIKLHKTITIDNYYRRHDGCCWLADSELSVECSSAAKLEAPSTSDQCLCERGKTLAPSEQIAIPELALGWSSLFPSPCPSCGQPVSDRGCPNHRDETKLVREWVQPYVSNNNKRNLLATRGTKLIKLQHRNPPPVYCIVHPRERSPFPPPPDSHQSINHKSLCNLLIGSVGWLD